MKEIISKYKKALIILVVLTCIIILINNILAKYKFNIEFNTSPEIALYVFEEGMNTTNLMLEDILPGQKKTYILYVSNSNDVRTTETAIEYSIELIATSNLPFEYNLYKESEYDNKNKKQLFIQKSEKKDEDITYISCKTENNSMGIQKQRDEYVLEVTFPKDYEKNLEYADVIESLEILVEAKQKI